MKLYLSSEDAVQGMTGSGRFAVARLLSEQNQIPFVHTHEYCEIYFSLSAGRKFMVDGKEITLEVGDVLIIPPRVPHRAGEQLSELNERFVIFLAPAFIRKFSTACTDLEQIYLTSKMVGSKVSLSESHQEFIKVLLTRITQITGFGSDLIEDATMIELLVILGRVWIHPTPPPCGKDGLEEDSIEHKMLRFIDEHVTEPLSITQISSTFYISNSYACRIFKREYGVTINKYIQTKRLDIAKNLLLQGTSVTETCEKSGFNDYTNFIKLFTRTFGVSPKKFSASKNENLPTA